jgi:hypothetical protein
MNKLLLTFYIFLIALTGCDQKEPPISPPDIPDIKITDLAPLNPNGSRNYLNTMNFEIIVFEIDADNLAMLENIWSNLYKNPIDFQNMFALKVNSFQVAFGEMQMWQQVGQMLDNAKAQKYNQYRFMLTLEKSEDIVIKKLVKPTNISYFDASLSPKTLASQKGRIIFNIDADKAPGTRGLCYLTIAPMLITEKESDALIDRFKHLSFTTKMTPKDFLIIAPGKNYDRQDSLSRFFFHRDFIKSKALIYAVFCMGIND